MNLLPLKQRRSALFTLVSVLAAAYAAPYLVPDSPDSLVFREDRKSTRLNSSHVR